MEILLRIYLVVTQLLYLLTIPTWMGGAFLAFAVLGSALAFEMVMWILFLPVSVYPFLVIGCSIYSWRNHIYKPIQSLITNFIPMLWVMAYWILRLGISS